MIQEQLTDHFIAERWPLAEVRLGATIREFDTRAVRIVEADEGRFVVKTTNQWRDAEDAATHLAIFDFLEQQGFMHLPQLLRTRDNSSCCQYNGQFAYILEYIDGQAPQPTELNYFAIGTIIGALHAYADYPYPYLFSYQEVRPEFDRVAQALPFGDAYLTYVQALPDFDALPQTLIHGEVIGNTLQRNNGALVVLDWDEAGVGPRVFDLGHPLIGTFVTEALQVQEALIHAFYRGYFSNVMLPEPEIEQIFDAALFYALRYIVYGDTQKRWRRLQWAASHRKKIMSIVYRALEAARHSGDPSHR
jgi:Ser/Thr protein kinase RdoA (MazF antagonist)